MTEQPQKTWQEKLVEFAISKPSKPYGISVATYDLAVLENFIAKEKEESKREGIELGLRKAKLPEYAESLGIDLSDKK